ncbi:MAG: glycosyltransferase [Prevotellaceae bacterium]|nr:glycosyltransferase [Prevotellaceae bacterium]
MIPLLSIIIPCYGGFDQRLVERCSDSVKQQGLAPGQYEIVLVENDGGGGLGGARNRGMDAAAGTYLLFLDADDYLFPQSLVRLAELLTTYSPDVLSYGMERVKAGSRPPRFRGRLHYRKYPTGAAYMLQHNFTGSACRHLFRRSFVCRSRLRFSEGCFHEDELFVAEAYALAGTTVVTAYPAYAYTRSEASITTSQTQMMRRRRSTDFRQVLTGMRQLTAQISDGNYPLRASALRRRTSMLTIDYLRQLIRNRSPRIRQELRTLRSEGFLPLPAARYGWKYTVVRGLLNLLG